MGIHPYHSQNTFWYSLFYPNSFFGAAAQLAPRQLSDTKKTNNFSTLQLHPKLRWHTNHEDKTGFPNPVETALYAHSEKEAWARGRGWGLALGELVWDG